MKLVGIESKEAIFLVRRVGDSVAQLRHWVLAGDKEMVQHTLRKFAVIETEGHVPPFVLDEVGGGTRSSECVA